MQSFEEIRKSLVQQIECRLLSEDRENWIALEKECKDAPLQYKPSFLQYQQAYFENIYSGYMDFSLVLYRGGKPVGLWPLCIYNDKGKVHFGTAGGPLLAPLLPRLAKAEAQRAVFEKCIKTLYYVLAENNGEEITFCETVVGGGGISLWCRKLMEHNAVCVKVTHQLYTDLSLTQEELWSRLRRTNKYSVAKGQEYKITVHEGDSLELADRFEEFHKLHATVAGRETRGQDTWDIQQEAIKESGKGVGYSFFVLLRDRSTGALAGAALFDTTSTCGLYCVAAYDRLRFFKPVGHIVQAVAMEHMQKHGLRWYEIGERPYITDQGANKKTVDIGYYKEGFATHVFPKLFLRLSCSAFQESLNK